MNPIKLHFWQLSFLFLLIAILALATVWQNHQAETSDMMTQMMGQSMGDMMRMMHAANITLLDLLIWKQQMTQSMAIQMHGQSEYIREVHNFTTNVIFFLTPFIISITMILLIVWHMR